MEIVAAVKNVSLRYRPNKYKLLKNEHKYTEEKKFSNILWDSYTEQK